jgi:hypothetical protein
MSVDFVTIQKFAEDIGMTPEAVEKAKTEWPEGLV